MNIETKTIREDVKDYINFGWERTEDNRVRVGRGYRTEHVLARDKDMANYRLLVALENKYFSLKKQKKYYSPIDGFTCFVLFLFFIIPGIIYVLVKSDQKQKIEEHNANIQKQMNDVVAEARRLL